MNIEAGSRKKIVLAIVGSMIIIFSILGFKQWKLLQKLIEEKSYIMVERYQYQSRYLENLENITANIILTNEISEKTIKAIRYLNEDYLEYRFLPKYYRYGYFKNKIDDNCLRDFIYESNRFFKDLRNQKVKLTDNNLEFLKKINNKAKELNSIINKYKYSIELQEYKKIFYGDILAKAVNEVNDKIDTEWLRELDYDKENNTKNKINKPKPEDIYGEKVLSEDEMIEEAQSFLGDFGKITEKSGGGASRFDDDIMLEDISFATDDNYEVEFYTQGGKIKELWDDSWDEITEENNRDFDESQINISREDAVNKLVNFLSKRGFHSLEVIEVDQYGPELEIRLAKAAKGYLNMEAEIEGKIDLTREGRLIELSFSDYWEGLIYDNSGYDKALQVYEKTKLSLNPRIVITDKRLVGRKGEGYVLDFYWRFTTEYDGDEYYIYVDSETGKDKDVVKVKNI